ncbi:hypothetical protein M378DRAFT_171658 [Amanita muscaria Koide BX008]|uniref:Pentatricopeptide repeat-containing protein n=1 Tax=Amanita muscaria (strain Koide BX008) TaxID=946122 RepID=A0A0C2S4D3_AMAMK|nr:hypothetical protein M378DRAFT_171658 [Amanita muscaria Koide BX008]
MLTVLRPFHASAALTRTRASNLLNILSKETHAPLWALIHAAQSTHLPLLHLTSLLQKQGLSLEEFTKWKSKTTQSLQTDTGPIPSWVVFHVVIYKVRSSAHANGFMMDFVFTHLDSLPLNLQGPLLIFSAFHLSKFNLLQPLTRVIDTFLTTELAQDSDALQFNLLLQALSVNSIRSPESANIAVRVLKAMEARQLKLRSETYHSLLRDRFVTVELTKYLRSRMVHEGFVPDVSHLEAYLRVFAKGGAVHEAQKYVDEIRKHDLRRSSSRSSYSSSHASTVALSGFKDRASAFDFLQGLVAQPNANSNTSITVLPLPRAPYLLPLYKKKLDTHDYTASLAIASRDPQIRTGHLVKMFRRMSQIRGSLIRPTIVSYTVAIRGLLYRNAIPLAERIWRQLVKAGYPLDRPALSVGLETLTRAGKPHEAFELLEKYACDDTGDQNTTMTRFFSTPQLCVDIHALNTFMESLNKINRPDIIFKLWDYMDCLYGLSPTSQTLSILLQAATLASQLDKSSFHGAVAHLWLRNPFRRRNQQSLKKPETREEMVDAIVSNLRERGKRGEFRSKAYESGIWNDELPLEGARGVFLNVIFGAGNATHHEQLAGIKPPAYALRISLDNDSPPQHTHIDSLLSYTTSSSRSYPTIIPTNNNFLQYLLLLGLNERAAEIPITLACMKALGIKPDRATLAVGLVFFAEVGMQPPLVKAIDEWRGRGEGNKDEYSRMVEWMKEWVGEERMPRVENLRKWQFWVKNAREK